MFFAFRRSFEEELVLAAEKAISFLCNQKIRSANVQPANIISWFGHFARRARTKNMFVSNMFLASIFWPLLVEPKISKLPHE